MDKRVSFHEALCTLLNAHNKLMDPRYPGDELWLPVAPDIQKCIAQYNLGHGLPHTAVARRVVLFADYGVRWPGAPQAPLEWFIKGIE